MHTYTSRNEVIAHQIVEPIESSGVVADAYAEFDIDAIADAVLGDYTEGYAQKVDADEFWTIVMDNAR